MDKGKGIWLSHYMRKSCLRRTGYREDYLFTKMILNLMAVVGFIFFLIVLLYLFCGLREKLAFYMYITICIVLELMVIIGWLYIYFRESAFSLPLTTGGVEEVRDSSARLTTRITAFHFKHFTRY